MAPPWKDASLPYADRVFFSMVVLLLALAGIVLVVYAVIRALRRKWKLQLSTRAYTNVNTILAEIELGLLILMLVLLMLFDRLNPIAGAVLLVIILLVALLHANRALEPSRPVADTEMHSINSPDLQLLTEDLVGRVPTQTNCRNRTTPKWKICTLAFYNVRADILSWCNALKMGVLARSWFIIGCIPACLVVGILASISSFGLCWCVNPQEFSTWISRRGSHHCTEGEVCHVYITMGSVPSEMLIHFHTVGEQVDVSNGFIEFCARTPPYLNTSCLEDRGVGARVESVLAVSEEDHTIREDHRTVHVALLSDLEPDTVYDFIAGFMPTGTRTTDSTAYCFRTLPEDNKTDVTFVVGGDMGYVQSMDRLTGAAIALDPSFAIIGGDLAYAQAMRRCYLRWDLFFTSWMRMARRRQSECLVPMVTVIGNHEAGGLNMSRLGVPFYLRYFAFDKASLMVPPQERKTFHFHMLMQNPPLGLLVLDTNIVTSVGDPEQLAFIRTTLKQARSKSVTVLVSYHIPAYPSHRDWITDRSDEIQMFWVPIFEEFGVALVFEHHDHMYKRTKPLWAGRVVLHNASDVDALNQTDQYRATSTPFQLNGTHTETPVADSEVLPQPGIIYSGDGCWGLADISHKVREINKNNLWYLQEYRSRLNYVIVCTASASGGVLLLDSSGTITDSGALRCKAIDPEGIQFDSFALPLWGKVPPTSYTGVRP